VLPVLYKQITTGDHNLREISIGSKKPSDVKAERSLNTSYKGYKVYASSTKEEAIVLYVGDIDEKPVFVLAALFDHDDLDKVGSALFYNWQRGKR
jgi:hypothetical protein